jgi:sialate O-acetylesterase
VPQTLYNAMIYPLRKFSIRGALWYQGEENAGMRTSPANYACLFTGMINAWRDTWVGVGDFAFVYAQLSSWLTSDAVGDIRIGQTLSLPKTGVDTTGMVRNGRRELFDQRAFTLHPTTPRP